MSERMVSDMRGWLSDCAPTNGDAETIADIPAPIVVRAVAYSYDGGIRGFIRDARPLTMAQAVRNAVAVAREMGLEDGN